MPSRIGRIDFKREIIDFLDLYNKFKNKTKKIQPEALLRLDKFINIFTKILIINCVEMLTSLRLVTLTQKILYNVYDIMINGNIDFTKETFYKFNNKLVREKIENSKLSVHLSRKVIDGMTYDYLNKDMIIDKSTLNILSTTIFDTSSNVLTSEVLSFWGINTIPEKTRCNLIITFILIYIFDLSEDSEVITIEFLEKIAKQQEFIKLDKCLGSFEILSKDKISEIISSESVNIIENEDSPRI